jgi:hypothetical protein
LVWRCFGKRDRSGVDKGKGKLKRADCEWKVRAECKITINGNGRDKVIACENVRTNWEWKSGRII